MSLVERTKSADGEEDEGITDNEIGHLSRQLQPSVSTSDLNATVHQGSLPSLLDKDDNAEADVDGMISSCPSSPH